MIKSVQVTNHLGQSIKIVLTEGEPDHGLIITSIDGLGPAKATINTTDISMFDGALYNSARLSMRNITMSLRFVRSPSIEDARQRTYKYFPIKRNVEIVIETDNHTLSTVGYVESNEPNIFSKEEGASISLVCPDPYLYSADGWNTTWFYGVTPLFEFEFSNESVGDLEVHGYLEGVNSNGLAEVIYTASNEKIEVSINEAYQEKKLLEMGKIEDSFEKNIRYEGDVPIGIIISIHALAETGSIVIANSETREVMRIDDSKIEDLTGSKITVADDIIINTTRGNKSILLLREGHYTNILNALEKGSDWFLLEKGDNIFSYSIENGIETANLMIENRIAYEGV